MVLPANRGEDGEDKGGSEGEDGVGVAVAHAKWSLVQGITFVELLSFV